MFIYLENSVSGNVPITGFGAGLEYYTPNRQPFVDWYIAIITCTGAPHFQQWCYIVILGCTTLPSITNVGDRRTILTTQLLSCSPGR